MAERLRSIRVAPATILRAPPDDAPGFAPGTNHCARRSYVSPASLSGGVERAVPPLLAPIAPGASFPRGARMRSGNRYPRERGFGRTLGQLGFQDGARRHLPAANTSASARFTR